MQEPWILLNELDRKHRACWNVASGGEPVLLDIGDLGGKVRRAGIFSTPPTTFLPTATAGWRPTRLFRRVARWRG